MRHRDTYAKFKYEMWAFGLVSQKNVCCRILLLLYCKYHRKYKVGRYRVIDSIKGEIYMLM